MHLHEHKQWQNIILGLIHHLKSFSEFGIFLSNIYICSSPGLKPLFCGWRGFSLL